VKPVPPVIDGAQVLKIADLSQARPTHATRHVVKGQEVGDFAGLALARYDEQSGVYLFYCDRNWKTVTDTYHETLELAIAQAEFEFGSLTFIDCT
jgi:hypothetical protein